MNTNYFTIKDESNRVLGVILNTGLCATSFTKSVKNTVIDNFGCLSVKLKPAILQPENYMISGEVVAELVGNYEKGDTETLTIESVILYK